MVERFHTRDPLKGMLRLGLNESFALICLPELLQRLEQRYPGDQHVGVRRRHGAREPALNRKELDIAVVSEPTVGAARVAASRSARNRLGWFASARLRRSPRRMLTPADLEQFQLIVQPADRRGCTRR